MLATAGLPNPDVLAGLEAEHRTMHGADAAFTTTNYNITTCPRAEYDIVVGERECPQEQRKDLSGRVVRRLRPVAELQQERMSVEAGLGHEEIVAVVHRPAAPRAAFRSGAQRRPTIRAGRGRGGVGVRMGRRACAESDGAACRAGGIGRRV